MKTYIEKSVDVFVPESHGGCINLLQSDCHRCHGKTADVLKMHI